MGLTIHYELEFKGSEKEAISKLETIKNIVKDLPVESVSKIWKLDYSKDFNDEKENLKIAGQENESYRWAKIQYQVYEDYKRGDKTISQTNNNYQGWVFEIYVGRGCEPTNIGLVSLDGKNWIGQSFTKTQYADHFVKAHLLVVTVLDVCKKIGILKSVEDEGEYWETRDLKVLGNNINESTRFIETISGTIKKIFGEKNLESSIDKSKNYVKIK